MIETHKMSNACEDFTVNRRIMIVFSCEISLGLPNLHVKLVHLRYFVTNNPLTSTTISSGVALFYQLIHITS